MRLRLHRFRSVTVGLLAQAGVLRAQFYSYDQVQEAARRASDAEEKFLIGAIVVGVVAAVLILRAVIHFRRRIRPGQVPDVTTTPPATVLSHFLRVSGFVFKIGGCLVILLYLASCADLVGDAEKLPASYAYFLSGSLLWLGTTCARQASRLRTPLAEDVLATDTRQPVLFLRCFSEEEVALSQSSQWWLDSSAPALLEEAVLREFQQVGPVIGLTNPRLQGRPGSYSPYDTRSENWQERAGTLIGQAAVIVVVLAQSESLAWEIRRLRDAGRLPRTLFILPPASRDAIGERLAWLLAVIELPKDLAWERIDISHAGTPQELAAVISGARARIYLETTDEEGYVQVVRRAIQDLGAAAAPAPPAAASR